MGWTIGLIGALIVVALCIPLIAMRIREMQLSRGGFGDVSKWTDADMIGHISFIFTSLGYRVTRPKDGDSGYDLLLADGLGQRRAVLVRHWKRTVDEDAVLNLPPLGITQGSSFIPMIITLERFTSKAHDAAKRNGVILWTLSDIVEALGQIKKTAVDYPELPKRAAKRAKTPIGQQSVAKPVNSDEPAPDAAAFLARHMSANEGPAPRCPRCGRKMAIRNTEENGDFWGCPNFPRCLGSKPL